MLKTVIPTYWYQSSNFGDCIAPYLVEKITGKKAVYVSNQDMNIEHVALVGSLLDTGPLLNTIVWGAGFASECHNPPIPKKVLAVRGQLSQHNYHCQNIDCPDVYGDPAILLPKYFKPEVEKKYSMGIIPHVADFNLVMRNALNAWDYSDRSSFRIIDLNEPVEKVIEDMLSCETLISSSLHGLIVGHAYGIPTRWVEFSNNVWGHGFKFRDYFTTVYTDDERPLNMRGFPSLKEVKIFNTTLKIETEKLMDCCPFLQPITNTE